MSPNHSGWFLYADQDNHFSPAQGNAPLFTSAYNTPLQRLTDWVQKGITATIYGAEGSGKEELLFYYFNDATCKALAEQHIYAIVLSGADMGRYQTPAALLTEIHTRACECARKYGVELTDDEKKALLAPKSDSEAERAHRVLWLLPQINSFISRNFTDSKIDAAIALLQQTVADQTPLQIIATNNYLYPDLKIDPDKPPSSYVFNHLKARPYTLPTFIPSKPQFSARIRETLPSVAEEDMEWLRLMTRGLSEPTRCLLECYQEKQQLSPDEREGKTVQELAVLLFFARYGSIFENKWLRFLSPADRDTLTKLAWDTPEQSFGKKEGFAHLRAPLSPDVLSMGLVELNGAMTKYRFTFGLLREYLRYKKPPEGTPHTTGPIPL